MSWTVRGQRLVGLQVFDEGETGAVRGGLGLRPLDPGQEEGRRRSEAALGPPGADFRRQPAPRAESNAPGTGVRAARPDDDRLAGAAHFRGIPRTIRASVRDHVCIIPYPI